LASVHSKYRWLHDPSWKIAIVEFAVLSALAIFLVRLLRHHPSDKDLNRY
jgi:membrane protein implicated in regulation of membrane protease activity